MSVVIGFPSEAAAMGFYESPEYQPVKELRLMSTTNWNAIVSAGGISVTACQLHFRLADPVGVFSTNHCELAGSKGSQNKD